MYRMNWTWAMIIVALAGATGLLVTLDATTPLRPWITLAFLLICPGMAFVQLLEFEDPLAEVVLAVALSLVLELGIAAVAVYGGFWAAGRVLLLVIALSMAGILVQLFRWHRGRPLSLAFGQAVHHPLERR